MSSSPTWALLFMIALCLVVFFSSPAYSSSFVLGKQYLLKQKKQNSSLVWYAVTFDRSITGGLKITLKVYSEKGKSLEFLDDYRDYVADDIAERCISKFAMTDYNMEFDDTRKGSLGFQVKSVSDVFYVPLKVRYEDGFEDYLVRIRIFNGKFAISTRPLQQGMLILPGENAVENYRAEQLKKKQDLELKEKQRKAQLEDEKRRAEENKKIEEEQKQNEAPKVFVNEELFDSSESNIDELIKESEAQSKLKEENAKSIITPAQTGETSIAPISEVNQQTPQLNLESNSDPISESNSESKSNSEPELGLGSGAVPAEAPTKDTSSPPTNSVIAPTEPEAPIFEKLEDFDQPISPLKNESNSIPAPAPKIEDEEIEIDGFEDALKEIERLENLEKNK